MRAAALAADRGVVMRWVRVAVVIAMLWSLALAAALAAWGTGGLDALGAIGASLASWTVVLFALNHALRFARWHWMLVSQGYRVPAARSLSIFLAGLALLPTPAKAGVAARSLLLLREGVPVHVSLAAYVAERLTDLIGLLMLASLLWGALGGAHGWLPPLAIAAAGMGLIWTAPSVLAAMRPVVARGPRSTRAFDWAAQFLGDARGMCSGWRPPAFVLLGAAANVATGVLLWQAVRAAPVAVELSTAVGVLGVSHLSGSISMLPGGLGGFELAMLAQLAQLQVPAGQALVALAVVRVATLWGSVAVGLPLLWLGLRRGEEVAR